MLDGTCKPSRVLRVEAKPQAGRVRDVDRQLPRRPSGSDRDAQVGVEVNGVSD